MLINASAKTKIYLITSVIICLPNSVIQNNDSIIISTRFTQRNPCQSISCVSQLPNTTVGCRYLGIQKNLSYLRMQKQMRNTCINAQICRLHIQLTTDKDHFIVFIVMCTCNIIAPTCDAVALSIQTRELMC